LTEAIKLELCRCRGTHGAGFYVAEPADILDSVPMRITTRLTAITPIFMTFTEIFPHVKGIQKFCHPVTRVLYNSITQSVLFITTCEIRDSAHTRKREEKEKGI
jgi:hypothetical protein